MSISGDSAFRLMPLGGSGRQSPGRLPTRAGRFVCRCIWWTASVSFTRQHTRWSRDWAGCRTWKNWRNNWRRRRQRSIGCCGSRGCRFRWKAPLMTMKRILNWACSWKTMRPHACPEYLHQIAAGESAGGAGNPSPEGNAHPETAFRAGGWTCLYTGRRRIEIRTDKGTHPTDREQGAAPLAPPAAGKAVERVLMKT